MADPQDAWSVAAEALRGGEPFASAVAALSERDRGWLTTPWAGSVFEVLALDSESQVLFIGSSPDAGLAVAEELGLAMAVETGDEAHVDFVDAWLPDRRRASPPWSAIVVGDVQSWDDGWAFDRLAAAVASAAEDALVLLVVDNGLSILRSIDLLRGKPEGSRAPRRRIRAALRRLDLTVVEEYGLLRSTVAPASVFALGSQRAVRAALQGASPRMGPVRRTLTQALASLASQPWLVKRLVPGTAIVAARSDAKRPPGVRVVARVATVDSDESKLLIGDPPHTLEKHYESPEKAGAEAHALETLGRCLPGVAPRLLSRPSRRRVRMEWLQGDSLAPLAMSAAQIEQWTLAAARFLAHIQRATRAPDGTVLVHGDYWLGNLLVRGDEVVAAVDWVDAHQGDPDADRRHLVDYLVVLGILGEPEAEALRAAVVEAMAAVLRS